MAGSVAGDARWSPRQAVACSGVPRPVGSGSVAGATSDSGDGGAPARLAFRPDVQGLRAIAVVLVVAFHSGLPPRGGFLGVDVFFVISGFVIGRLLLSEQARTGRIALGRFYARRVRRLLPALVIVIGFVAIVSIVAVGPLGSVRETTKNTGIGAALYLANFAILHYQQVGYFDPGAANNPFLHTWTLGVEEQFYLFFPLLLIVLGLVARPFGRRRGVLVVGVSLAALASLGLAAVLTATFGADLVESHGRFAFYASPTRAWEFLVGVLVALAEPRLVRVGRRVAGVGAALGLVAIFAGAWVAVGSDATIGVATLAPVLGAALVILSGTPGTVLSERVLSARPMVWIGDRSYGWYLWHWPFMVFARLSFPTMSPWVLLGVGILALVPTELSYRYVEQPIRHSDAWLGWRAVATGVVGSGVAILVLLGVNTWAPVPKAAAAKLRADLTSTVGPAQQCYRTGEVGDANPRSACIWRVPDAKGKIVVIGDSHAWAINSGMVTAARQAGYDENMIYRAGCPFADVIRVATASVQRECRDFVEAKTEAIIRTDPALVVLVSNQDSYVHLDSYTLRDPVDGRTGRDEKSRAQIWQAGLTRTLQTFADNDIPAVVVSTVPQLAPFDLTLCPAWRLWVDPSGCVHTIARSTVDRDQHAGRVATANAVRAVPGSRLVSFEDDLCTPEVCSTRRDGRFTYRDQTHISPTGAELLVPRIEREVIPFARG